MDLFAMLSPAPETGRFHGVAVAVVTANNDPDKQGRVKVTYPWLSGDDESHWARVVSPGAGKDRGLLAVPAVDDEVLVAFEHGLVDSPYVIGGLWNGSDAPPRTPDDPADVRSLTTRAGHVVRLDDTADAERIEILAAGGKSTIVLDAGNGTITVTSDADLVLESANGAVKITGATVDITAAKGAVTVQGNDVELSAKVGLKQSGATAEVKASANLTLKGAVVNIN